jgi:spore maturation protein CgeB
VNIHWNDFGLGNQRLYHLPANGVMQISDCPADLGRIFEVDDEVVAYRDADELIDKISYYLAHPEERNRIAAAGYRRTVDEYLFPIVTRRAANLIQQGMNRIGWKLGSLPVPQSAAAT